MVRARGAMLMVCTLALAGCNDDKCKGEPARLEVTLQPGSSLALSKVTMVKVSFKLAGGKLRSKTFKPGDVKLGADNRFTIDFSAEVTASTSLELSVEALDSKGGQLALGQPSPNPLTLSADACNFVTVALGKGGATDGGADSGKDIGGGLPTVVLDPHKQVTDLQIRGGQAGDRLGPVVACDLNKDGYDDIAVGAPLAKGPMGGSQTNHGRVYVLLSQPFNKQKRFVDVSSSGSVNVTIYGADRGDNLGQAMACGFLDNDKFADLVIAAPNASDGKGKVYVLLGGSDLTQATFDLTQENKLDATITGRIAKDHLGTSLAMLKFEGTTKPGYLAMGAPGFDGLDSTTPAADGGSAGKDAGAPKDGSAPLPDAMPGKRKDAGAVFLISSAVLAGKKQHDLRDLSQVVVLLGASADEALGTTLAAGDMDNNPLEDLAAGGPGASNSGTGGKGVVRLLAGQVLGAAFPRFDTTAGQHSKSVWGPKANTGFAKALVLGDVDGDTFADLVVGAPTEDKVYVVLGGDGTLAQSGGKAASVKAATEAKAKYLGEKGTFFGRALGAVARNKGDKPVELLVGAPSHKKSSGAVYWFKGRTGYIPNEKISVSSAKDLKLRVIGSAEGDALGTHLGSGLIHKDDDIPDVLFSAPTAGGSAPSQAGKVYGVLGSAGK